MVLIALIVSSSSGRQLPWLFIQWNILWVLSITSLKATHSENPLELLSSLETIYIDTKKDHRLGQVMATNLTTTEINELEF